MAVRERILKPPANDPPISAAGRHSHAWAAYHEDMANGLGSLEAEVRAKLGVTDGSDATAGQIGEYLSAEVTGSAISSGAVVNLVTLALTAGDWDLTGNVITAPAGGTSTTLVLAGISATSLSITAPAGGSYVVNADNITAGRAIAMAMARRINLPADASVYLVAQATFGGGTLDIYGFLGARRAR